METPQQIEEQAQLVEVLSRESEGIDSLISSITGIDTWTNILFVKRSDIDNIISRLTEAKNRPNGDPLKEAVLLFNTDQGNILDISDNQIDSVGDHLKDVFLPSALDAKILERNIAIDLLKDMRDGII